MVNASTIFSAVFYVFSTINASSENESTLLTDKDAWAQFTNFQERFSKKYESVQELEDRFNIFRSNFNEIIAHNLDIDQNFTMGVNQFTDLTPAVQGTICGRIQSRSRSRELWLQNIF